MKALHLLKVLIPLLFIQHCASSASAQTPTQEKKEEYRIKMMRIENGKTTTIDTTFNSREDLEKFQKENMELQGKKHTDNPPFNLEKMIKEVEKEITVKGGDTTVTSRVKIVNLNYDSLHDILILSPQNEETTKKLHEQMKKMHSDEFTDGDLKEFNLQLNEYMGDLPEGAQVKIITMVGIISLEEPTKEELKENKNTEIKESLKEKQLELKGLNIYPNPSSGKLNLDIELAEKGKTQLLVTDLQGKEVYREEFVSDGSGMQTRQLDLSEQAGGVYLLKIKTGDKSTVKKFIIQQSTE